MTRTTFAVLLALVLIPTLAFAGGRFVYRLAVNPPAKVAQAEGDAKLAYVQQAGERLEKRFAAAAVKEYELRYSSPTTLVVETGWDHNKGWMEALMTSPGKLEIRRVTPDRPQWLGLVRTLPDGIELRGDEPPHVWSANRRQLQKFLSRVTLPNGALEVFPDDGGFRSVSLGEIVATERQLRSAEARQSATGESFVALTFHDAVGASLAAAHVSEVENVALVLDGELVGFVPAKSFLDRSLVRVAVPDGAVPNDRSQRDLWARQVAGRLAAPLPIAIAVLKE